jgi:hypothetical protein
VHVLARGSSHESMSLQVNVVLRVLLTSYRLAHTKKSISERQLAYSKTCSALVIIYGYSLRRSLVPANSWATRRKRSRTWR